MEFIPTEEQQQVLDLEHVEGGRSVIVTGEAGSGKTATASALARKRHVNFITPTHQAGSVLRNALLENGVESPSVITVAKYLKKFPDKTKIPEDVLATEFTRGAYIEPLKEDTVNCVDEGSMVDISDLISIRNSNPDGLTIVVIDPKQLSPVNSSPPYKFLDEAIKENRATLIHLTKNHRSTKPELTNLINHVRTHGNLPDALNDEVATSYENILDLSTAAAKLSKEVGQENVVILAHKNSMVRAAESHVRRALGYVEDVPAVGEVLRMGGTHKTEDWKTVFTACKKANPEWKYHEQKAATDKRLQDTSLQNGDLVEVTEVLGHTETSVPWASTVVSGTRVAVLVKTGTMQGLIFEMNVVPTHYWTEKTALLSPLRELLEECKVVKARAWDLFQYSKEPTENDDAHVHLAYSMLIDYERNSSSNYRTHGEVNAYAIATLFWSVREMFAEAGSAMAMTVHKAQGSGRDHVFVVAGDFKNSKERKELLYTAVSRARNHLHILR